MPNDILFVSRKLAIDSPIHLWAKTNDYLLLEQSLLRFSPVEFELPVTPPDWIFFYSPRAVTFFMERGNELLHHCQLAAIGKGTAGVLKKAGFNCAFTGSATPDLVAEEFAHYSSGKRVLFPQTLQSRRTVELILGDRIEALPLVVYQTEACPPTTQIPAKISILTSPLNVEAWFTANSVDPSCRYLALGPSTAEALANRGIKADYPDQPTDQALVKLLD